MFTPSKELKRDIDAKNIVHIRDELTTIALEDRGFHTGRFDEALEYVKGKHIDGLFDLFDKETFKEKAQWDSDYWKNLNASLMDNFCMERINHLKEVGKTVYPKVSSLTNAKKDSYNGSKPSSNAVYVRREMKGKKSMPIVVKAGVGVACLVTGIATVGLTKTMMGIGLILGGALLWRKKN